MPPNGRAITEPRYMNLAVEPGEPPWPVEIIPSRLLIEGPDGSLSAPHPIEG